ncbi:MaoC family dehydratase N-terminal domain-containing protein [Streptacidiphilus anmyonensis]|uniref:MaoC family dehydratase N-terminal domain-containing protein n=1 Tax=Streptacidiphilus anmyonensis TaxID=405782 RepID=UPI0005A65574|nr:MaoC family dehydratase N-terminal domain-containing protein [Streptacidiphilus anmyonensis]
MTAPGILDAVGRTYPPTRPYEVGREHVRSFAEAVGDPSTIYRDVEAARAIGHPDVLAPPTFPVVFTQQAAEQVTADPELGVDFSRVVHGGQRFVYERPLHAGDRLTCVVVIEEAKTLAGNVSLTLRTEVSDEDGSLVLTEWSTLVVRAAGT